MSTAARSGPRRRDARRLRAFKMSTEQHVLKRRPPFAMALAISLGAAGALVLSGPQVLSPLAAASAQQERAGAGTHGSEGHGGGALGRPGGSSGSGGPGGVGGQFGAGSESHGLGGGGHSGYGYWGGRHVPEGPGENPNEPPADDGNGAATPPSSNTAVRGGGYGAYSGTVGEGRCDNVGALASNPMLRITGENLGRLTQVAAMLSPQFDPEKATSASSPIYAIAVYQEELENAKPDLVRAGTYLGAVARVRVTSTLVERANAFLCVPTDAALDQAIAAIAEKQRESRKK